MNSIYIRLVDYKSGAVTTNGNTDGNIAAIKENLDTNNNQFIEIFSYSNDVEQTLSIGSQSTGAGAGKITFNPVMITRHTDALSPLLLQYAASGSPFKTLDVLFTNQQNLIVVRHTYKMVAVKTISWSADPGEDKMMERVSFEYGGFIITYNQQGPDGRINNVLQNGWNRVRNVRDVDLNAAIV